MKKLIILLGLILIFTSGCTKNTDNTENDNNQPVTVDLEELQSEDPEPEKPKLKVYTSFFTMYDFAKKIGGDRIEASNMVPPGTEVHHWEPGARDIAALFNADVFIYNGAEMEGWVESVLSAVNNKNLLVVETSLGIELINMGNDHDDHSHNHDHDHSHNHDHNEKHHHHHEYDPHVWLNPMNAKIQMQMIMEAFIEKDPENRNFYEDNFKKYALELDELDKEYREAVAEFKAKEIIVSHEAYGYLCDAYGLRQLGVKGLYSDVEPSPARMAEITRFAKKHNVKVIFFEEMASSRVVDALAKDLGIETAILNPIEGISKDDLEAGRDYFYFMRQNLETLKKYLTF
ncbi:UNVERIFIED_CONTAM: zinc transport system substrate-binding protein [Acetivibrio alkalicellulosi]